MRACPSNQSVGHNITLCLEHWRQHSPRRCIRRRYLELRSPWQGGRFWNTGSSVDYPFQNVPIYFVVPPARGRHFPVLIKSVQPDEAPYTNAEDAKCFGMDW